MNRPFLARQAAWLVPLMLLLISFGRLVIHPSNILVDADRPTVDRARVVAPSPGNDLTRQYWPLQLYITQTLARTGHLPQWDDRGFGGRPLVGNPQAGLGYPPVWLAWVVPAPATLGWITLGHLVWASLGVNRLARTLGLGEAGPMVAAGCFSLSPYVLAQTFEGHYPHVWAAAWYPWAFEATIRFGRGRWRAGLTLVVCLAAVVLVGHPQEGYYLVLALGCWVIADLIRIARGPDGWRKLVATVAVWLGLAGLTLGLVAVEIIPAAMAQEWGLRSDRLPLRLASRYHPLAINAIQFLNPFALGGPTDYSGPENYWETVVGVGLVPLVLAGVGATWTRDRRRVAGWGLLVLAALLFAAGRKLGLFTLMYHCVPGMDRFRVSSRTLFLANLGVAILAGFGVEALRQESRADSDRWSRLGRGWLLVLGLLIAALSWGTWQTRGRNPSPIAHDASKSVESLRRGSRSVTDRDRLAFAFARLPTEPMFGLAVVGLSVGLGWAWLRPARRGEITVGLGLLALAELAGLGHQLLVVSPPSAWLDSGPVAGAIQRACPIQPGEPPGRIRADEAAVSDLTAVQLDLSKTDINDSFQIQHAADLYERLYDLSRPRPLDPRQPLDGPVADRVRQTQQAVFDRLGVAVATLASDNPRLAALVAANHWPIVATVAGRGHRADPITLARNPSAMPRAYVVPRAEVGSGDGALIVGWLAGIDPQEAVMMTRDPLASLPIAQPRQSFRAAKWVSSDPDRIVIHVTTENPGLLVVADTWMPGWTATVDGRDAAVERGNHAQRVVALPEAGRHEVVLTYRAPGFRLGWLITLGSVVVWVSLAGAGIGVGLIRRRAPI